MDIVEWKNLDPVTIPLKGTTEQEVVYTTTDHTRSTRDNSFIRDAKLAIHGSTGAQLVNLPNKVGIVINGVTWTSKDNVITAIGETGDTMSQTNRDIYFDVPITAGNFHISGGDNKIKLITQVVSKTGGYKFYINNASFTLTGDERSLTVYLEVEKQMTVNNTVKVMLNKGNIALPFEPYTGGTPYTNKYTATIKSQTENNVILSIENVSELAGDSTVLDVVLTDKNDITKRSENGKNFTGGEQV